MVLDYSVFTSWMTSFGGIILGFGCRVLLLRAAGFFFEDSLTRERIRQIETASIKRLKQLENLDNYLSGLKNVIIHLLEEHGGLMEKEYLFNNLVNFSIGAGKKGDNEIKHKRHFDFLIF